MKHHASTSVVFAVSLLMWPIVLVHAAKAADPISGTATVLAGNLLMVNGQQFRLRGIRVPDLDQTCEWPEKTIPCGDISRTALMDLVVASQVDCEPHDTGQPPLPATCYVDGFDVGRNMVHTGWALADGDSPAGYHATEAAAKAAKRGLWKGSFDLP